jgi:hypothetical protein
MLRRRRQRPPSVFPPVEGATLDGAPASFPEDLKADSNLLVVTFHDSQDPLSDLWILLARRMAAESEGRLEAYEVRIAGRSPRVLRPVIHDTLAAQAEDDDERERTLAVHVDRKDFRQQLGLRSDDGVYVFLVARDGRIRWRGQGALTPQLIGGLERALAKGE